MSQGGGLAAAAYPGVAAIGEGAVGRNDDATVVLQGDLRTDDEV